MVVKEETKLFYNRVGIFRDSSPVARYFYDVHVFENGLGCYYMWKRNEYRFPLYHHLKDFLARNKRNSLSIDDSVKDHVENLMIKFDDIQGVVTDREHKEIQLLSVQEELKVIFRPYEDYDEFDSFLKDKLGDRYFTRDNVDIEDSVYV